MLTQWFEPLGRDVSRVGLGTTRFALAQRDGSYALLDAWLQAGANLIDTAVTYCAGEAEQVLGAWLRDRGVRETVVVLTKGGHPGPDGASRIRPDAIAADLALSLDRLGGPPDIYMLHRDDPGVPVGEIVDALHEHVVAGRVRSVGGSNWRPGRLAEADAWARAHGRTRLTSSSPYFGLAIQASPPWPGCVDALDPESRAWYARPGEGLPLFAWSSQSSGWFSGGFEPTPESPQFVAAYDTPENRARRERARQLGARLGVTAPQVALAYVMGQPFRPFALMGAVEAEDVRAGIAATAITLDAATLRWLETGDVED